MALSVGVLPDPNSGVPNHTVTGDGAAASFTEPIQFIPGVDPSRFGLPTGFQIMGPTSGSVAVVNNGDGTVTITLTPTPGNGAVVKFVVIPTWN